MQQADEILDFLNTKLGAESLAWQGDHASIKFEDETIIDFVKIDMHTVELVHVIEKFTGVADATICANLLIGNYQGGMTGAARLSLTPDFKTLALCSRIDVRAIDTVLFEEMMTDFLKYAQFWNSDEAASYLQDDEEVMNAAAAPQDAEAFMTRV